MVVAVVAVVVVMGVLLDINVLVCMVAVNNVRGHVLMQDARYDLNSKEAADEAAHHQEAGLVLIPVVLGEVAHGGWQHAVEGREEHDTEAQAKRRGKEGIALLDTEVALAREEADRNVDADDGCAEDTGEAAEGAHDPASRVIVHGVGVHGVGVRGVSWGARFSRLKMSRAVEGWGVEGCSDVIIISIFYSGLRSPRFIVKGVKASIYFVVVVICVRQR